MALINNLANASRERATMRNGAIRHRESWKSMVSFIVDLQMKCMPEGAGKQSRVRALAASCAAWRSALMPNGCGRLMGDGSADGTIRLYWLRERVEISKPNIEENLVDSESKSRRFLRYLASIFFGDVSWRHIQNIE